MRSCTMYDPISVCLALFPAIISMYLYLHYKRQDPLSGIAPWESLFCAFDDTSQAPSPLSICTPPRPPPPSVFVHLPGPLPPQYLYTSQAPSPLSICTPPRPPPPSVFVHLPGPLPPQYLYTSQAPSSLSICTPESSQILEPANEQGYL